MPHKIKILSNTNKEYDRVVSGGELRSIVKCRKFLFLSRKGPEINVRLGSFFFFWLFVKFS